MNALIPYAWAAAASDTAMLQKVVSPIITNIVNPVVKFLVLIAVVYFVWGVVKMIINAKEPSAHEEGRKHMMYGLIGLFIMISAWAIVYVISNSVKEVGNGGPSSSQIISPAP